jgi:hypothetical protein
MMYSIFLKKAESNDVLIGRRSLRLPGCPSVFSGLIIVSAINAALWERRPAATISDMLCKHRGETPLSQRWMAETMVKAGLHALALEAAPVVIPFGFCMLESA